jgi:hypothetical protein
VDDDVVSTGFLEGEISPKPNIERMLFLGSGCFFTAGSRVSASCFGRLRISFFTKGSVAGFYSLTFGPSIDENNFPKIEVILGAATGLVSLLRMLIFFVVLDLICVCCRLL